jgi:hypothetical protein
MKYYNSKVWAPQTMERHSSGENTKPQIELLNIRLFPPDEGLPSKVWMSGMPRTKDDEFNGCARETKWSSHAG